MPIDPANYTSQLWQEVVDLNGARASLGDLSQKLEALAGAIPPPTVLPVSAFRAYRAAALTLSGTASQQLVLDAVDYDTLGEYNPNTGIWSPQNAGLYLITAGVALNTNQTSGVPLQLQINDVGGRIRYLYYSAVASTSTPPQMNGCDHFNVPAGAKYQVNVSLNPLSPATTTAILTGSNATWFSATQVR